MVDASRISRAAYYNTWKEGESLGYGGRTCLEVSSEQTPAKQGLYIHFGNRDTGPRCLFRIHSGYRCG